MRLKIVEQFSSAFTLEPDAKEALVQLLTSEAFCRQIDAQTQSGAVEFTGLLFQPVPYTPQETKGMPAEYEPYHDSPDYVIINVPPNFMFKAKIFSPSRLCAIYRKVESL